MASTKNPAKQDPEALYAEAQACRDAGNRDRAEYLLKKAARLGHPIASYVMGSRAFQDQDYKEAGRYLEISARAGNPDAQAMLGNCLCRGLLGRRDANEGQALLRKAVEQGHVFAHTLLGVELSVAETPDAWKQAEFLLRYAAERGSVEALSSLASLLIDRCGDAAFAAGRDRAALQKEAGELLLKAYRAGDNEGARLFALNSISGALPCEDPEKAIRELLKELDEPVMLCVLGNYYQDAGKSEEALAYYTRSVEAGCAAAVREIGIAYRDGAMGLGQDIPRALECFWKAGNAKPEGDELAGRCWNELWERLNAGEYPQDVMDAVASWAAENLDLPEKLS